MKPKSNKNETGSRDRRRHTRDIVSKLIKHSRCYICIMWEGKEDEAPMAVIDLKALAGKDTLIAKSMGKMAQYMTAALQVCNERTKMTIAQLQQSDMVEKLKEERSAALAKFLSRPGEEKLKVAL